MYLINKRTNQVSKDESKYATPGWLVCTEQEYTEALEAQNAELVEALTRIVANPAVQDLIEANPQTNYLIRDARAAIKAANG